MAMGISDIIPKPLLNYTLAEIGLPLISLSFAQLFGLLAESTTMILPYSVQNWKTIGQQAVFLMNFFSSLWWVSKQSLVKQFLYISNISLCVYFN